MQSTAKRWGQRLGVSALLVAPVAGLLALTWPEDPSAQTVDVDEDGGPIELGDGIDGVVAFNGVTHYTFTGTGDRVTFGVRGDGFDSTLTIVDAGSGEQLATIDDTNGTDPELDLVVADGQSVEIEVRGFGGAAGSYTVYAQEGASSAGGGGGDGGDDGGGPTITVVPLPPDVAPEPRPAG